MINVLDIVKMNDYFQVSVVLRGAEILIESNFRLGMYVKLLKKHGRGFSEQ